MISEIKWKDRSYEQCAQNMYQWNSKWSLDRNKVTSAEMFKTKNSNNKKSEDVKKSAGKVLDTKKDTPTRAKVRWDINIVSS